MGEKIIICRRGWLRPLKTLTKMTKAYETLLNLGFEQCNPSLLEELFDHAQDIVFFVKDDQGRYLIVNEALVERHGFSSKEQVLGKQASEICPGELGQTLTEQDHQLLRDGKPIHELLELHWYSPHRPGWCLTTKLPMRNSAGQVVGIIGISQDVRSPIANDEIPAGVTVALRYLEKNFAEAIGPTSLAEMAGLAPARFARIIKRVYRLTPNQLISKTRISAAVEMLAGSDRPIAEIASACGFYDHSAFTRAFRLAMGVSPSGFRNQG
jgi:PAS domain S-box-containing protein